MDACPSRVEKQNQSSEGSSIYSFMVSSYEHEARICADRFMCELGLERKGEKEAVDLFCWMPGYALDVLLVFHQHGYTFEICIRVN